MSEDRPLEQLTLRELFIDLERLVRELGEHVEQDLMTKINAIRRLTRPEKERQMNDEPPVSDAMIRSAAADFMKSEYFSENLSAKIGKYIAAVEHVTAPMVSG